MLSDGQITKFQTLWEQRFKKKISKEEAYEKGAKLLRLVQLTYLPMTEKEYQRLQKRCKETENL